MSDYMAQKADEQIEAGLSRMDELLLEMESMQEIITKQISQLQTTRETCGYLMKENESLKKELALARLDFRPATENELILSKKVKRYEEALISISEAYISGDSVYEGASCMQDEARAALNKTGEGEK